MQFLLVYEGNQATEGRFTAVELPGEAADPDALVKHLVDHAAGILDMEDAVREHLVMHKLQVIVGPDFFKRLAMFFRALSGKVGAYDTQHGIHGMVHRTGIDGVPGDLTLQGPINKLVRGAGVHIEVANLVRLALAIPVALIILVVAGMHHHDVARLDMQARLALPLLEVLRGVNIVIADAHRLQIYYHARANQLAEWNAADVLPVSDKVKWRIQVGADVQRG